MATVKIDYSAVLQQIQVPPDDPRLALTHLRIEVRTASTDAVIAGLNLVKAQVGPVRSVEAPLPPGDYVAHLFEINLTNSQRGELTLTKPFTVPPDVTTVTYLTLDPAGTLTITFVPAAPAA